MSAQFRPAPPRKPRRDPNYKPTYTAAPLRDGVRTLGRTIIDYAQLMRLDKPIGTWLLMWPALWALWIAGQGHPDQKIFIIFMVGVVVMRAGGCVINDYADRDFDPHVRRTFDRPLAARRVTPGEALTLFVGLGLVATWLALLLEPLAQLYAVGAALLAVTYPFVKRYLYLPQFYLGVAFGWSIPMAFAEITGGVPRLAWLLLVSIVLWAGVYDTMYAMVDRKDDLRLGLKSTAILFGDADRVIVGAMQVMTLVALYLVGQGAGMTNWYHAGLGAGAVIFIYEQWLIRGRDPDRCFQAFRNNHYFGMVIFIGLALDYLFR